MRLRTVAKTFGLTALAIAIVAVVFSRTHTPGFKDTDGNPLPGSIAEERHMTLGGAEQYVLIRGQDRRAPLLVFLHGGPGYPAMPINRVRNADLERDFVFVNWDQRGAGSSFSAGIDPATLTLAQITSDLDALITALTAEFGQDKVLLVGHSWGSLLGLNYIARHPEKVQAYVGVAQFSNGPASETESYEWTLKEARKKGDAETVDLLTGIGTPPYDDTDEMWAERGALHKMGGVWAEPKPGYFYVLEYLKAPEFAWPDLLPLMRGGNRSMQELITTAFQTNAVEEIQKVEVPVFFIHGRLDHVVSPGEAERYLQDLEAPQKEFIWFENSAHMPNWEEVDRFHAEIRRIARQVGALAE